MRISSDASLVSAAMIAVLSCPAVPTQAMAARACAGSSRSASAASGTARTATHRALVGRVIGTPALDVDGAVCTWIHAIHAGEGPKAGRLSLTGADARSEHALRFETATATTSMRSLRSRPLTPALSPLGRGGKAVLVASPRRGEADARSAAGEGGERSEHALRFEAATATTGMPPPPPAPPPPPPPPPGG